VPARLGARLVWDRRAAVPADLRLFLSLRRKPLRGLLSEADRFA